MKIELGKKYLITTDNWFVAPDGQLYMSLYGTVTSIETDDQALGIKTNRGSTNWYVVIGNMIVAGCQVHYALRVEEHRVNFLAKQIQRIDHEGKRTYVEASCETIYYAD